MRIYIDQKNITKIKKVSYAVERSNQYVVNTILDYYFSFENPEKKLQEILTNNLKKIKLNL